MKTIKQYLLEGLFDNDDNLVDKNPTEAIYSWLKQYTSLRTPEKLLLMGPRGLYSKHGRQIILYDHIPDFIQFDMSKNNLTWIINISNLTQKDLDKLPGTIMSINDPVQTTMFGGKSTILKDLNIKAWSDIRFYGIEELKNVNIDFKIKKKRNISILKSFRQYGASVIQGLTVNKREADGVFTLELPKSSMVDEKQLKELLPYIIKNIGANLVINQDTKYGYAFLDASKSTKNHKEYTQDISKGTWMKILYDE